MPDPLPPKTCTRFSEKRGLSTEVRLAHELRTLFQALKLACARLKNSQLSAAQEGVVATLQMTAEEAIELANDQLEPSSTDPSHIIRRQMAVAELFSASPASESSAIKVEFREPTRQLLSQHQLSSKSAKALGLISRNLMVNAISHLRAEGAGGTVVVELAQHKDQNQLKLTVTSSASEARADDSAASPLSPTKLFQPTKQTRQPKGFGLPLAKAAAEQAGGTMHAAPAEQGWQVWALLPLCLDHCSENSSENGSEQGGDSSVPIANVAGEQQSDFSHQRPRILVADDSASIRELLELTLESAGYTVFTVSDGHKALALAKAMPLAAMILDIEMPQMGGVAVAEAVASLGIEAKLIALSGEKLPQQMGNEGHTGEDRLWHLAWHKPVSGSQMTTDLRALLAPEGKGS